MELAAQIDQLIKKLEDSDESSSMVAQNMVNEIVHSFLLPEVHRRAARQRLAVQQKKYLNAAHEELFKENNSRAALAEIERKAYQKKMYDAASKSAAEESQLPVPMVSEPAESDGVEEEEEEEEQVDLRTLSDFSFHSEDYPKYIPPPVIPPPVVARSKDQQREQLILEEQERLQLIQQQKEQEEAQVALQKIQDEEDDDYDSDEGDDNQFCELHPDAHWSDKDINAENYVPVENWGENLDAPRSTVTDNPVTGNGHTSTLAVDGDSDGSRVTEEREEEETETAEETEDEEEEES